METLKCFTCGGYKTPFIWSGSVLPNICNCSNVTSPKDMRNTSVILPEKYKETDIENLKKKFVFWRWKEKSSNCLSKSYVRDVIETEQGATIIELANDEYSNSSCHRVLLSEIEIYTEFKPI